jgi:hypothetical protein
MEMIGRKAMAEGTLFEMVPLSQGIFQPDESLQERDEVRRQGCLYHGNRPCISAWEPYIKAL